MIDAYTSESHYDRHVRPVFDALGPSAGAWYRRGSMFVPGEGPPVLVASGADALAMLARGRQVALMQHGAGQSYNGAGASNLAHGYVGGAGLDGVGLFLAITEHEADAWRGVYPDATVRVVGYPALDNYVNDHAPPVGGDVAVTFHWKCTAQIEAGTAWPTWRPALQDLAARDDHGLLLGSEHPRWHGRLLHWWQRHGVETTADPDVLLYRAGVLVADNTSLMYEAMALGIPVIGLQARGWRREVEHGLRFWRYAPPVDLPAVAATPGLLSEAIRAALAFGPRPEQAAIATAVLGPLDGLAASRAADALAEWAALVPWHERLREETR